MSKVEIIRIDNNIINLSEISRISPIEEFGTSDGDNSYPDIIGFEISFKGGNPIQITRHQPWRKDIENTGAKEIKSLHDQLVKCLEEYYSLYIKDIKPLI